MNVPTARSVGSKTKMHAALLPGLKNMQPNWLVPGIPSLKGIGPIGPENHRSYLITQLHGMQFTPVKRECGKTTKRVTATCCSSHRQVPGYLDIVPGSRHMQCTTFCGKLVQQCGSASIGSLRATIALLA